MQSLTAEVEKLGTALQQAEMETRVQVEGCMHRGLGWGCGNLSEAQEAGGDGH